MTIQELQTLFISKYGHSHEPLHIYFSPGRINLIGEHTDYNGGYVLPAAISYGTYCCIRKNSIPYIECLSVQIPQHYTILLNDISKKNNLGWANYIIGVYAQFVKKQLQSHNGYQILIYGNVPQGAGLSSSASLEMSVAYAINDIEQYNIPVIELASMCQQAEHEYAGVHCGIMDQFASGMGKKDSAIYLNCKTLDFSYVPIVLDEYNIIITNSNSPHALESSKYNERVNECKQAVKYIQQYYTISQLSEISVNKFKTIEEKIPELYRKRARHVITEIDRTQKAVEALNAGKISLFGNIMNESHNSLQHDYEVTGMYLDTITSVAQSIDGCIGSRMTGGGFGGSTISIVHNSSIQNFITIISTEYHKITGIEANCYIAQISNGTHKII
jgi:galactokinase